LFGVGLFGRGRRGFADDSRWLWGRRRRDLGRGDVLAVLDSLGQFVLAPAE
jgi:hypothetical protein